MDKFLFWILTIPLIYTSLWVDLYNVHNLPILHPEIKLQLPYDLEGQYMAVSKHSMYTALPTGHDIHICIDTQGSLCMVKALYPFQCIK